MECEECPKYRDGWCLYKGVMDPAAIRADRRSRWCHPVPPHEHKEVGSMMVDYNPTLLKWSDRRRSK